MKIYTLDALFLKFPLLNFNWINEINIITNKIEKPWNFVGGCSGNFWVGFHEGRKVFV